jgi:hypothetical protein
MNILAYVLMLAFCFCHLGEALSQEKSPELLSATPSWRSEHNEKLMKESQGKERERLLYSFCQRGMASTKGCTGLARTPFGGSGGSWICRNYLSDKKVFEALDASKRTDEYLDEAPKLTGSDEFKQSNFYQLYFENDELDKLKLTLTADQLTKLPGAYLRIEGMMALCRPDFTKLFDAPERQAAVQKCFANWHENVTSPLHRAIFVQSDTKMIPMFSSFLRRVSTDADCEVVLFLSNAERDKLLALIEKSRSLDDALIGPGSS